MLEGAAPDTTASPAQREGKALVKSIIVGSSAVVALFLTFARVAAGDEKPVDALAVLKQTLNERGNTTISAMKTTVGREIHYCPDNTCDIFKASGSVPEKTLRAIAAAMNTAKFPAPRAGRWNPMTVSLILKREKA